MSRRNTYRVFDIPQNMPGEMEIAAKGFASKAKRMLEPPVSMFGIPAMRKLAQEIVTWNDVTCFQHMVAYAGMIPPLIAPDLSHNDGLRWEQARVLREMADKYGKKQWDEASRLFTQSGECIIQLCHSAITYNGKACGEALKNIAETEEQAYQLLR